MHGCESSGRKRVTVHGVRKLAGGGGGEEEIRTERCFSHGASKDEIDARSPSVAAARLNSFHAASARELIDGDKDLVECVFE